MTDHRHLDCLPRDVVLVNASALARCASVLTKGGGIQANVTSSGDIARHSLPIAGGMGRARIPVPDQLDGSWPVVASTGPDDFISKSAVDWIHGIPDEWSELHRIPSPS